MIWASAAKNYLAAFAAKDMSFLEEAYTDEVELRTPWGTASGKQDAMAFHRSTATVSIRISNTCYRDKYVCIEYLFVLTGAIEHHVSIIEFDRPSE